MKRYIDCVKQVLSEGGDACRFLLDFMGDTTYTPETSSSFREYRELFYALTELKLIREETNLIHPSCWFSRSPGRTSYPEGDLWVIRDMPNKYGDRNGNVYEWADETDDIFEFWGFHNEINRIQKEAKVLDLCAGAGSIGMSFQSFRPDLKIFFSDISERCKQFFELNMYLNSISQTGSYSIGDLWQPVRARKFDYIFSVPPFSLTAPGAIISDQFDGGEYGDRLTSKIIEGCHSYLSKKGSEIVMLLYTLGDRSGEKLRISDTISRQEKLNFEVVPLKSKKVWRFKHTKAFSNGMPIEFMVSRFGDPFKEDFLKSRSKSEVEEGSQLLEKFERWIFNLQRDGWTHLWYCGLKGKLK